METAYRGIPSWGQRTALHATLLKNNAFPYWKQHIEAFLAGAKELPYMLHYLKKYMQVLSNKKKTRDNHQRGTSRQRWGIILKWIIKSDEGCDRTAFEIQGDFFFFVASDTGFLRILLLGMCQSVNVIYRYFKGITVYTFLVSG